MTPILPLMLVLAAPGAASQGHAMEKPAAQAQAPGLAQLKAMEKKVVSTPLKVDVSGLSEGDRLALVKLIEASRVIDEIFLKQYWAGNGELAARLQADASPLGKARLRLFQIYKGPWADLDEHRAFVDGVPARKPLGANYYPEDMTKEEFETWEKALPKAEQEQVRGFFSVIRRDAQGKLTSIPYDREYQEELTRAAALLREAATLTGNESLRTFLQARADAFLSNDYYLSDLAWMDVDAPVDVTIGPYETYADELFGYKAAFEAYVNVRDDKESTRLGELSAHLQEIENNIPVAPEHRNPKLGASAPIRVVNEVLSTGDGAHGVRTAAFNLPNDERVVAQKGSKRVMLKNVQQAKFNNVLLPIADRVLAKPARADVSFDSFFIHILAHELSHGLGRHQITVDGRATTPRAELKDLYGAIEEARADALGLFSVQFLLDNAERLGLKSVKKTPASERQLYTTFLASSFRTLRFGINEAHGRGMALQLNYLMDRGAVTAKPDGTFGLDIEKFKTAIASLVHDIGTLEATGDRAGTKKMLDELAVLRPEVKKALDKLQGIPTDVYPDFVTAQKLAPTPKAGQGKPKTAGK